VAQYQGLRYLGTQSHPTNNNNNKHVRCKFKERNLILFIHHSCTVAATIEMSDVTADFIAKMHNLLLSKCSSYSRLSSKS
jgi:hypothetical protein